MPAELRELLRLGGSAWTVSKNVRSLQRRVDGTVQTTFGTTVAEAGQAGSAHLREAYANAFGMHPNPGQAYGDAIKAVEAAGAGVVIPADTKATLGKVIDAMRTNPSQWRVAIDAPGGANHIVSMMDLLWTGQTDRHGRPQGTTPVTAQVAEAAVFLASTPVYWFSRALVERPSHSPPWTYRARCYTWRPYRVDDH